jgi:hypothetical protein|tara:strand:- start:195 stop:581 length:387 start_codon:yes stop_codon:yes gene_type:complete
MGQSLKISENKVPVSLRSIENQTILFRLVNPKQESSKSYQVFKAVQHTSTLTDAFRVGYRAVDYEYDTTKNNRFKKVNLLSEPQLNKSKKAMYQDLLNQNAAYIKSNKVSDAIKKAQDHYSKLVSNLK